MQKSLNSKIICYMQDYFPQAALSALVLARDLPLAKALRIKDVMKQLYFSLGWFCLFLLKVEAGFTLKRLLWWVCGALEPPQGPVLGEILPALMPSFQSVF